MLALYLHMAAHHPRSTPTNSTNSSFLRLALLALMLSLTPFVIGTVLASHTAVEPTTLLAGCYSATIGSLVVLTHD